MEIGRSRLKYRFDLQRRVLCWSNVDFLLPCKTDSKAFHNKFSQEAFLLHRFWLKGLTPATKPSKLFCLQTISQ